MTIMKNYPLFKLVNSYVIDSPEPSNISYLWNFGPLLGLCLITGFLCLRVGTAELPKPYSYCYTPLKSGFYLNFKKNWLKKFGVMALLLLVFMVIIGWLFKQYITYLAGLELDLNFSGLLACICVVSALIYKLMFSLFETVWENPEVILKTLRTCTLKSILDTVKSFISIIKAGWNGNNGSIYLEGPGPKDDGVGLDSSLGKKAGADIPTTHMMEASGEGSSSGGQNKGKGRALNIDSTIEDTNQKKKQKMSIRELISSSSPSPLPPLDDTELTPTPEDFSGKGKGKEKAESTNKFIPFQNYLHFIENTKSTPEEIKNFTLRHPYFFREKSVISPDSLINSLKDQFESTIKKGTYPDIRPTAKSTTSPGSDSDFFNLGLLLNLNMRQEIARLESSIPGLFKPEHPNRPEHPNVKSDPSNTAEEKACRYERSNYFYIWDNVKERRHLTVALHNQLYRELEFCWSFSDHIDKTIEVQSREGGDKGYLANLESTRNVVRTKLEAVAEEFHQLADAKKTMDLELKRTSEFQEMILKKYRDASASASASTAAKNKT